MDIQGIGSEGGGGAGVLDGAKDELRGEGSVVVVEGPFVVLCCLSTSLPETAPG